MKTMTTEEWEGEFYLALTAAHATDSEVAEAMAEVTTFCADSGQTPAEAFGNPREYVKQLGIGRPASWRERFEYLIHVPTMLGIFVVFDAVRHLTEGTTSSLTWGHLAAALLLTLTTIGFAGAIFRGRAIIACVAAAVGMAAAILAAVTFDRSVVDYAPAFGLIAGGVLLVVPATVGTLGSLRDRDAARAAAAARGLPGSDDDTRLGTAAIIAAHWGVIVAAAIFSTVIALVTRAVG